MPSPLLDRELTTIYKNSMNQRQIGPLMLGARREFVQTFLKPINSVEPTRYALMTNGGAPAANLPAVSDKMLKTLATVIAQAHFGNGSTKEDLFRNVIIKGRTTPGIMTIRQFMTLEPADQMAAINQAWNKVCTKKSYNKLNRMMIEPMEVVVKPAISPVPSGAIPDGGGGMIAGYTNVGKRPDAFTGLGVGFRVDGSGTIETMDRSILRVTTGGMTTQLKNRWFMHEIRGWEVDGTVVDLDTNAPRVWRTKKDLFNESAVCVSRNFYGATAFPTREMDGEQAVLWAVDVAGLIGFDTEGHQLQLEGNKQWRPGEKAFKKIPVSRIMGYVKFNKLGCSGMGGWKFSIPADAEWTFIGNFRGLTGSSREAQAVKYVTDQLVAWRGVDHTISGAFDFA